MQNFYFYTFYIFYFFIFYFSNFLFFGGLGPAQPTWAGLNPASRPGHWPKPMAQLGKRRRSTREVNSRVHE